MELTPTEYKLLRYLLADARRVLTREQILEAVWDYTFAGNASVIETYIRYLREKVDAANELPAVREPCRWAMLSARGTSVNHPAPRAKGIAVGQDRRSSISAARFGAALLVVTLVAAGCGGASKGSGRAKDPTAKEQGLTYQAGESGLKTAGQPRRGGTLIYGLEADTNGGFCLPSAQLAISGMMVVRAVYDTLTIPNAKGEYVPNLAQSVEPNADYTEWTITVRPHIKFHDGSPLTAKVVKNNIDAFRGTYPGRASLLGAFVFKNVKDTKVVNDRTMKVVMSKPWVAFPAYLYGSSRFGIMAQAQLDDKSSCERKLIGTGPFKFVSWTPNQKLVAKRNPQYWQTAPDGKAYPYAEGIEFRPIPDTPVRNQALEGGNINLLHTSNAADITTKWKKARDAGKANLLVSEAGGEVAFLQLNETIPPFNDLRMRQALAIGADRAAINKTINHSLPTVAKGPFAPDSIGYVKDTGIGTFDAAQAKKLVDAYRAEGKNPDFTLTAVADPLVRQLAELTQQKAAAVGVKVKIVLRDQAALINDAIGKKYQAMTFRNYPGGDPDINYVWWYSGETGPDGKFAPNPVNFAGIKDATVDKLLDEGRAEPDPAKRKAIYQQLDKRMGGQVHGLWSWFTPWAIVESPKVHNVFGPPLPGDDPSKPGPRTTEDPARQPYRGLATGHSLIGLWIEK
ncbi:MAG: ABC transporter substrate-binding protein [Acidimicrobiales bacterium]